MRSGYHYGIAIYDVFLYNGEADVLDIRFHELQGVVEKFVIVEADHTFSGRPKAPRFLEQVRDYDWPISKVNYRIHKIRIPASDPWQNETNQRNSLQFVTAFLKPKDLVILSDVDEIPRSELIAKVATDFTTDRFGLALRLSYFKLNFVITAGPDVNEVSSIAFRSSACEGNTFEQLRMGIRSGTLDSKTFLDAGWHFSYVADDEGIHSKLRSFSHQELNTPEIHNRVNVDQLVRERQDLYSRTGFIWEVTAVSDLPSYVRLNSQKFRRWLA